MRIQSRLWLIFGLYLTAGAAGTAFGQVFPVFPSGTLADGSSYRSTITIGNLSSTASDSCQVRLQPIASTPTTVTLTTIGPGSWLIWRAPARSTYVPTYAVVTCDQPTSVQVRYAYYSNQSTMVGEVNVPASNPVTYTAFVMDSAIDNTRIALAVSNDSDVTISATVSVYDPSNSVPLTLPILVAPRTTFTQFVDEITGWKGTLGIVSISSSSQFNVTGLRFTGPVLSTLLPIASKQASSM